MPVNPVVTGIIAVVVAYLLGSIPSAYIVTRFKRHQDIRSLGGGNVGSLNVMRQVGIWPSAIVGISDVSKGIASILIGKTLGITEPWLLGAGFSAVVGHCYPVYIGFRGGRGMATTIGIFLVLSPIVTGIACAIIGLLVLLTRNVFFSVIVSAPFFLVALWFVNSSPALMFLATALIIFMGVKSRRAFINTILEGFTGFMRKKND
jgi:glycerol-3-phosphate acyltransferase PlsY